VLLGAALWGDYAGNNRPTFAVAPVVRTDLESVVLATGTLQPFRQVDVGAQVSGQVKSLKVQVGDKVTKGQLLAEIDPVVANNNLRAARAQLDSLAAQRRATEASLHQSDLALARQRQLFAKDAGARQDLETAEATFQLQTANAQSLDAQIEQQRIAVDTAVANLAYTRIEAPIAGEVAAIITQEGQTVVSAQTAPVILKLVDTEKIVVRVQVPEADVIRVEPGQTVYFVILGDQKKRYYGTLRSVEPAPDSFSRPESQAPAQNSTTAVFYNARFDVPNTDGKLKIGMTAQVSIELATAPHALTIPVTALGESRGKDLYVVRVLMPDGTAQPRNVDTGISDNMKVQVLAGLSDGDKVIIGWPAAPTLVPRP
jgi:macrolide-specific efflux system membrane fusion protein